MKRVMLDHLATLDPSEILQEWSGMHTETMKLPVLLVTKFEEPSLI